MFLANVDVLPEYFYIFLEFRNDIYGKINYNNFCINNQIVSPGMNLVIDPRKQKDYLEGDINYLPFVKGNPDINSPSTFMLHTINEYNVEYCLEIARKKDFKKYPSRLSAIYAFGDYESCIKVSQKYGWKLDSVRKFRLIQNSGCEKYYKIGRFNMEIVSLLRGVTIECFPTEDQEKIYKQYWEGSQNVSVIIPNIDNQKYKAESGMLYEYLIEGILECVEE